MGKSDKKKNTHNPIKTFCFTKLRSFVSFFIFFVLLIVVAVLAIKAISLFSTMAVQIRRATGFFLETGHVNHDNGLITPLLHSMTQIIIIVKAYRILESYVNTHHISLTYLVEIAIISSILEVIFNYEIHTLHTNMMFSGLGVALLVIYYTLIKPSNNNDCEDESEEIEKH